MTDIASLLDNLFADFEEVMKRHCFPQFPPVTSHTR